MLKHSRAPQRFVRLALFAALAFTLASCAVFADKQEYGSYRKIRLASDEHEKLLAMHDYAQAYPKGNWSGEVGTYRKAADERLWNNDHATLTGLEYYLEVFPDGAHAAEARPRLAALAAVESRRAGEAKAAKAVVGQRQEETKERKRTWMGRAVEFWTTTLTGISNWGSPIADVAHANGAFSKAFGRKPKPRCSKTECVKFYAGTYAIPVPGGTRMERSLTLYLRIKLVDGNVERAEFLLPNKGFSRWYEQENATPVLDEDTEQRSEVITWALDHILPSLEVAMPGAAREEVIPDPIEAPKVKAPNEPETIEDPEGKGEPTPAAPPPEAPKPAEPVPATPVDPNGLDALLDKASGGIDQPKAEPAPAPAPVVEEPELILPVSLYAITNGKLRIVVFASPENDNGKGYDGIYIERVGAPKAAQAPKAPVKPAAPAAKKTPVATVPKKVAEPKPNAIQKFPTPGPTPKAAKPKKTPLDKAPAAGAAGSTATPK